MIKVSVDTEEELNKVRGILKVEACNYSYCPNEVKDCNRCIFDYCKDKVILFKRETVEHPVPTVV